MRRRSWSSRSRKDKQEREQERGCAPTTHIGMCGGCAAGTYRIASASSGAPDLHPSRVDQHLAVGIATERRATTRLKDSREERHGVHVWVASTSSCGIRRSPDGVSMLLLEWRSVTTRHKDWRQRVGFGMAEPLPPVLSEGLVHHSIPPTSSPSLGSDTGRREEGGGREKKGSRETVHEGKERGRR